MASETRRHPGAQADTASKSGYDFAAGSVGRGAPGRRRRVRRHPRTQRRGQDDHAAHDRGLRAAPIRGSIDVPRQVIVGRRPPAPGQPARHRLRAPRASTCSPGMSIYENLLVGAYTVKDKKRSRPGWSSCSSCSPGFTERRDQLAGTLSGGERKMLAIGRGLMPSPSLMLVDEPSAGSCAHPDARRVRGAQAAQPTRHHDPAGRAEREHHAPPRGPRLRARAGQGRPRGDRRGAARATKTSKKRTWGSEADR